MDFGFTELTMPENELPLLGKSSASDVEPPQKQQKA